MNILYIIDKIFSYLLNFLLPFIYLARKLRNLILKDYNDLVIVFKLYGAGNFISFYNNLNSTKVILVTHYKNKFIIDKIKLKCRVIYIRFNFLYLPFDLFRILTLRVSTCINLEAESGLAKILCALTNSRQIRGVSSRDKSISDFLVYDYFLDSSINRNLSLSILLKENIYSDPNLSVSEINSIDLDDISNIFVFPSCSPKDNLRRLKISTWTEIFDIFLKIPSIKNIYVIFGPNDPQYSQFKFFKSQYNLNLIVPNNSEFLNILNYNSKNLYLCIDSLALHLASFNNNRVIAFFTSSGVNDVSIFRNNVISIYSKPFCSPCSQKYISPPCKGFKYCEVGLSEKLKSSV